uniref:Integrase catalytic domain-containing protein n=1 Tax=Maylandia zebra TaxID=106582 RepID=A0A3P9BS95_9CICH
QKQPLKLHQIPDLPWSITATDLFEWDNRHYLVLVDSYSGWFEIDKLENLTSASVINKLKHHFSVHGIPQKLYSDNGTQFISQTFREFATHWEFIHVTSSPEFPQSNGLSERAVRSAKRLLETSKRDGTDFYLNLLHLRNTPRDNILGSPAQRLLSRRTRSTLPVCKKLLTPTAKVTTTIKTQLTKKRKTQKQHYDKSSKLLSPLTPNEVVRLQTQRGHDKIGVVSKVCAEPRSYVVESGGKEYRRNRQHLLPVSEPQPEKLATTQDELDSSRRADETKPNKTQTNKHETVQLNPPQHGTKQSEQVITPTKCQVRSDDNLYRTRSGRVSKPNSKYVD